MKSATHGRRWSWRAGTGLGALIGVMQEAFENDHAGTIYLFHGAEDKEHLYFVDELVEVADRFKRFHYVPCVRTGAPVEAGASGAIQANVEHILPNGRASKSISAVREMRCMRCSGAPISSARR
jgi:NAD(P)H-flavin reductase